MLRKTLIYLFAFLINHSVLGQYFQFSQYDFTPQRVNPAQVAASDYATVDLIYRRQQASQDLSINSTALSASYPLILKNGGKRWAGIGVSFLDDRSGEAGIFKINEVGLTTALNAFLSRYQTLSLGFKALYQSRRLSMDALYTGSQYIPDRGFDLSVSPGESISQFNRNLLTFSTGLHWQMNNRNGKKLAYAGISLFDFNKPAESFFENDASIPATCALNLGLKMYEKDAVTIFPEALITRSASKTTFNLGAVSSYELRNPRSGGQVNLITKYVVGKYGIAGLQLEKENFKIGFSYDMPISQQVGNRGTFEVGIEIKRLIRSKNKARTSKSKKWPSSRKKRPKKDNVKLRKEGREKVEQASSRDTSVKEKVAVEKAVEENEVLEMEELHEEHADTDSLDASARAGELERSPLLLEKTKLSFHFEFESIEIDEDSRLYLKELALILKHDLLLRVNIIGHTDATGNAAYNLRLSERRAEVVREILLREGVATERITVTGKGESEPLYSNQTEEGRSKNRRVEFVMSY